MTKFFVQLIAIMILATSLRQVRAQAVVFNVKTYGAIGDGVKDDTLAINTCIAAANTAGGGTAYFPKGTYKVSVKARPFLPKTAILLKPNVSLTGDGRDLSIIRLANQQGSFDSMIEPADPFSVANNITISKLGINGNSANNPVASANELLNNGLRVTLSFRGGNQFSVQDCRFFNIACSQTIALIDGEAGLTTNATVLRNKFDLIGGGTADYDHSTIFTQCSSATLNLNTFASRNGAGTLGATTAIEIHGPNQVITGNTINGFAIGAIVTGIMPSGLVSKNQLYQGNVLSNVGIGFRLWGESTNTPTPVMRDITIKSNTIGVNVKGWYNVPVGGGGVQDELGKAGIAYTNPDGGADNVRLESNTISFSNYSNIGRPYEYRNCGISFLGSGNPVRLTNLNIIGNTVNDPPGNGIYMEFPLGSVSPSVSGVNIVSNTINRPGRGFNLGVPNRYAILMLESVYACEIHHNQFKDNQATPTIKGGIYEETTNLGFSYYYANTLTTGATAVPMFTQSQFHAGPNWIPSAP
jgi:hypothetical protein